MKNFLWNWQLDKWPNFYWNEEEIIKLEKEFLYNSGMLVGAYSHFNKEEKTELVIEIMENEAIKSSEIEGEFLNRDSLQSSIKRNFGLSAEKGKMHLAESGIADMMVDLYKNFKLLLTEEKICQWHKMLMNGREDLENIGSYRIHKEAMQIVSGPIGKQRIHFEAPPSDVMECEMKGFIDWLNKTTPNSEGALPALTRTAIAHMYFVCIHPFEDGNGRLARAIAEKCLLQSLGQPVLITLSQTINRNKKQYYFNLEDNNKTSDLTKWIMYFANTILDAQKDTIKLIDFVIKKTKFYDYNKNQMNARQGKVIARVLEEGISGFAGGLSASNYISIAKTSASTATRDLQDLVDKRILKCVGQNKSTRYYLQLTSEEI